MEHSEWANFWEHLSQLRQTLIRSLLIVCIGFIIVLTFYEPILQFLADTPLNQTDSGLNKQQTQRFRISNQKSDDKLFALPSDAWLVSEEKIPVKFQNGRLYYHLAPGETLFYEQAISFPLLILSPIEGIVLVFKMSFWLSITLTAPFWGWTFLQFILPGLKAKEKALLIPFLFGSVLALCLGITFAYFVTLPVANQYLLFFNHSIGQNAWTMTHFVNYVLLLCLGHAIAAELGFILFLLVHFRVLSSQWLSDKRRYMIVLAFILGALLTPPDVLTQLLMAFPLIALYEMAILYAKWRKDLSIKRKKFVAKVESYLIETK